MSAERIKRMHRARRHVAGRMREQGLDPNSADDRAEFTRRLYERVTGTPSPYRAPAQEAEAAPHDLRETSP